MIAGFIVLFLSIVSVAFYQFYQLFYRLFFGNVLFDALFLLVEADFASSGAHIAVVGVRHFSRTCLLYTSDIHWKIPRTYRLSRHHQ